jgi:hypothetical protein
MKVLPLKGYKSLKALNAFHTLLLGLKMLPAYALEAYDEFYEGFANKSEAEKEKFLREAILFVPLQPEEVDSLIAFCTDSNGIAYQEANIKNLGPDELVECIVAVCMEIGKIKIELMSQDEKKKSLSSA